MKKDLREIGSLLATIALLVLFPVSHVAAEELSTCHRDICIGSLIQDVDLYWEKDPNLREYTVNWITEGQCLGIRHVGFSVPEDERSVGRVSFVSLSYIDETGEILALRYSRIIPPESQALSLEELTSIMASRFGEANEVETASTGHFLFYNKELDVPVTIIFNEVDDRPFYITYSMSNFRRIAETHEAQKSCGLFQD